MFDLDLVGRTVQRQMLRDLTLGSWKALEQRSGVSRTTLWRIKRSQEVGLSNYAKIEAAFGLPSDTLVTIAAHEVDGLTDLGVSPDLSLWVKQYVVKSYFQHAHEGSATG